MEVAPAAASGLYLRSPQEHRDQRAKARAQAHDHTRERSGAGTKGASWRRCEDSATGEVYYFNAGTGRTVWTAPGQG